ncbi:hypothetical protein [Anaerocolumna xylanovorans]|uniref:Uncharacterized protein n=1 Tax=Anaerocolumna xylanovorans DSM 12503 TaxID=1121345 RepID=A0A1M7Y7V4_9FIRM|nr:hypothetical protein [Anaerocolumna xylanovorans]SHO48707.1 hypothetical protein SAMN02745217_01986 [Anaerocolumna xylanovorans DSM 12503]
MRNTQRHSNPYYAEIFTVDIKSYEYVFSVGIDMITNKYVTEYSRCIERSFVTYSENTYTEIDYKTYLEYLKQAQANGNISKERYNDLKQKEEPDITSAKNIEKCYERIAKQNIREMQKCISISTKLEINKEHVYKNYESFCDKNDFLELYLNRYSQNQGWCVRIVQNDAGYRLSVIYHAHKLPDLYEEPAYMKFLAQYNSDADTYSECDVYEKQLAKWEKDYLIHALEEEYFYEQLAPKMKIHDSRSIGCIGSCEVRVKYKAKAFFSSSEKIIHGFAENDDKNACGIDFYGFIQKCKNIAAYQSKLVSSEE